MLGALFHFRVRARSVWSIERMSRFKLRIVLRDDRVFFAGDLVEGVIVLDVKDPITTKALTLAFSATLSYW